MTRAEPPKPPTSTTNVSTTSVSTTGPTRYIGRLLARARAFDAVRPWVWDTAVTGTWTVAALVDAAGGWRSVAADPTVPSWLVVAVSLALALPLHLRRRHPTAALVVMAAATLVSEVSGAFLQGAFLQVIPLFHIALTRPPRALLWAAALLVPPLVIGGLRFQADTWDAHASPAVWSYLFVALLGITVRSRREERDQEVRLAAADERARIAREMHDIIGHNLAVITGLADGGRYAAAKNPERAAQALDAIGTTSRQALAELRRLLGVLGDEETAVRSPQPGLDELPALIDGVRRAGLPVDAHLAAPAHPLPPGAQLTVYRVVQESLTNTLKHGGPAATATVTLAPAPAPDDGGLVVTVTDTGRGRHIDGIDGIDGVHANGNGNGIAGMRERAALYEGTLECGPPPTGGTGWQVRLRLPARLPAHLPAPTQEDSRP
ncbi:sensor histidine kinase [Streptomyces sp. NPDC090025]|uniref:sensor histidine kinase n=1 Tax=Streptomyces sp. NPDC090025 TaxID=3365922 RepID=UPI003836A39C